MTSPQNPFDPRQQPGGQQFPGTPQGPVNPGPGPASPFGSGQFGPPPPIPPPSPFGNPRTSQADAQQNALKFGGAALVVSLLVLLFLNLVCGILMLLISGFYGFLLFRGMPPLAGLPGMVEVFRGLSGSGHQPPPGGPYGPPPYAPPPA